MAINLSTKSANELVQAAALEASVLTGALSEEYDFVGAKTVKVVTAVTQDMNDYQRTGMNRYGTPTEVQDTVQEMTLTQDKGFSLTVDKGNLKDQNNLKKAEKILRLQVKEKALPLYDTYVLAQLKANAGTTSTALKLTKTNVVEAIMDGGAALDDAEIPSEGRTLFISAKAYKFLKISEEFIQLDKLGTKSVTKGLVGEIDGMRVVKVPSGRMPSNTAFIIVHKESATAPKKLADAKIHQDPPGLSGNLIEGRWYYDAFVLEARAKGVYAHIEA